MVRWCFHLTCDGCRRPRCTDIDLTHDAPSDFLNSQLLSPWLGLVWNIIWCLYFLVTWLIDVFYFTESSSRRYWFLHLTNWCFTMAVVTTAAESTCRLLRVVKCDILLKDADCHMPWSLKLVWTVFNINNVTSIINMIFYLAVIPLEGKYSVINRVFLPSIYVILNVSFICTSPIKLFHFYQPVLFLVIYSIFNAIYQSSGHSSNQKFITDWTNQTTSIFVLICMVILAPLVIHVLLFFVHKLRIFVFYECVNDYIKDEENIPAGALQRHATATEVILEDMPLPETVDVNLNVKDDISVKAMRVMNGDVNTPYNARLYKSETDLRDYTSKNGFYCDFVKSCQIVHHKYGDFCESKEEQELTPPSNQRRRGSQIIVVKTCNAADDSCDITENNGVTSKQPSVTNMNDSTHYVQDHLL